MNYSTIVFSDELTTGAIVYIAYHPELPQCKAQGNTILEAQQNLDEATEDFIACLIEDNLPVPLPMSNRQSDLALLLAFDGSNPVAWSEN